MIFGEWGVLTAGLAVLAAVSVGAMAFLVRWDLTIPTVAQWALLAERSEPSLPRVSVMIPARNESAAIEETVTRWIAIREQDGYAALELILIDDRSTDGTGAIMHRLAADRPWIRVLTVEALPAGWMGKNHALWLAAQQAEGDYFLFTDADVLVALDTVNRAVAACQVHSTDHVTVIPRLQIAGWFHHALAGAFYLFFVLKHRPWEAAQPKRSGAMGVGAFNLVSRSAYEAIGTHQALAMRPDDDMALGRLLKGAGYRQGVAYGGDHVTVAWYPHARALVEGLQKNAFALMGYRWGALIGGVAQILTAAGLPWLLAGAFVVSLIWLGTVDHQFLGGVWLMLSACAVVALVTLYHWFSRRIGASSWGVVLYPVSALVFAYVLVASAWQATWGGGIRWRETVYVVSDAGSPHEN
jgi:hypothetical protein